MKNQTSISSNCNMPKNSPVRNRKAGSKSTQINEQAAVEVPYLYINRDVWPKTRNQFQRISISPHESLK